MQRYFFTYRYLEPRRDDVVDGNIVLELDEPIDSNGAIRDVEDRIARHVGVKANRLGVTNLVQLGKPAPGAADDAETSADEQSAVTLVFEYDYCLKEPDTVRRIVNNALGEVFPVKDPPPEFTSVLDTFADAVNAMEEGDVLVVPIRRTDQLLITLRVNR